MIHFLLPMLVAYNPDILMQRERTMRLSSDFKLTEEFDRQTRDTTVFLTSIFPRPCQYAIGVPGVCEEAGGLHWIDSSRNGELRVKPILGVELREAGNSETFSNDGGVRATGGLSQISFYLDARVFTNLEPSVTPPFDGEYVERQKEGNASHLTYNSFSRYRARLSLESSIGRISAGRESQNWGPSANHALVLSQHSVPYNQLDWTVELGPFSVRSLVAELSIQGVGQSRMNEDERLLYAHRYEWRGLKNLTLGISEALILYNRNAPVCFLPIVPLFIQKGLWYENINNGELAFDANYRLTKGARFYGEFMIDDMNSPTTLFDNNWKSKWAAVVGAQFTFDGFRRVKPGFLIEWSRVEPWVYTHYEANTSQALNQGLPLGNQLGPNSQVVEGKLYLLWDEFDAGLNGKLLWKGGDYGSNVNDTLHDNESVKKEFLTSEKVPGWIVEAEMGWRRKYVAVDLLLGVGGNRPVLERASELGIYRRWGVRMELQI